MAPSARGTTQAINRILSGDLRGYEKVTAIINQAFDIDGLKDSFSLAFSEATEYDTSFIYISTHGEKSDSEGRFSLLFSNGETQYSILGTDILEALSVIPGQKVLVLDSCYSGGIIPKGGWQEKLSSVSIPDKIIILTSSGADELSYNWSGSGENFLGGSYFSLALESALSASFNYQADENRDGFITLGECKRFLADNLGTSSVQSFPETSDFVLTQTQNTRNQPTGISSLSFDSRILTKDAGSLSFSFVLHQPTDLSYMFVYSKESQWLFDDVQVIHEGIVSNPGYQERTIELSDVPEIESGYSVLIIARRMNKGMIPLASTLLSVEKNSYEPIQLSVAATFNPFCGEELALAFTHERPCRYSLHIYDAKGNVVSSPALHVLSRPQSKQGSTIYWDGKDSNGYYLSPGRYWAQITVYQGNQVMTAFSSSFWLEDTVEKHISTNESS
jgi:hypothetical protein